MSAKNKQNVNKLDVPDTLDDCLFYGMRLDEEQKELRDAIWNKDKLVVFCNAKAGTGKTMVSVGVANLLVQYKLYKGIVYIASPTQEQIQGFLPGDIEAKSAPYMEPLYEALATMGVNPMTAIVSDNNIDAVKRGDAYVECLTHTYLRGMNFENKVVIVDEAQNYYFDELKKVLTRIHDNCKLIVIGHTGQVDLFKHPEKSGFKRYLEHFKGDDRVSVCELTQNHRGWISTHADELEFEK